ncbi:MAG: hypothetical protein HC906_13250 [Bacteroidales bacterium]|nr:hypothetical protein [Bacteroidales bacterium]
MVKLILGSNYLGEAQITYIKSAVLTAVKNYTLNRLPSVLIFDDFDAAAVMSLNLDGYFLDAIVFKKASEMTPEDIQQKQKVIIDIIKNINSYNHKNFMTKLGNYYKN